MTTTTTTPQLVELPDGTFAQIHDRLDYLDAVLRDDQHATSDPAGMAA